MKSVPLTNHRFGDDLGGRRQRDRVEEAVRVGDVEVAGLDSGLVDQAGDAVGGFAFGAVCTVTDGACHQWADPLAVISSTASAASAAAKVTV